MHVEAITSRIINGSVIVVTCIDSQIMKADEEYQNQIPYEHAFEEPAGCSYIAAWLYSCLLRDAYLLKRTGFLHVFNDT